MYSFCFLFKELSAIVFTHLPSRPKARQKLKPVNCIPVCHALPYDACRVGWEFPLPFLTRHLPCFRLGLSMFPGPRSSIVFSDLFWSCCLSTFQVYQWTAGWFVFTKFNLISTMSFKNYWRSLFSDFLYFLKKFFKISMRI